MTEKTKCEHDVRRIVHHVYGTFTLCIKCLGTDRNCGATRKDLENLVAQARYINAKNKIEQRIKK